VETPQFGLLAELNLEACTIEYCSGPTLLSRSRTELQKMNLSMTLVDHL
jgi:hypothetical protein